MTEATDYEGVKQVCNKQPPLYILWYSVNAILKGEAGGSPRKRPSVV